MQLKLISPLERELKRLNLKLGMDSWKVLRKYFKLHWKREGSSQRKCSTTTRIEEAVTKRITEHTGYFFLNVN